MAQTRQKFHHLKGHIDATTCDLLYTFLRENVTWGEGIKSKNRHTRSAAQFSEEEFVDFISDFKVTVETIMDIIYTYSERQTCAGIYLNYYKDGNDWTPNHTHPGTTQIVISLGGTRTFLYGKKEFESENGDILIFGSGTHGVPKEPEITHGRISIALFMTDDEYV